MSRNSCVTVALAAFAMLSLSSASVHAAKRKIATYAEAKAIAIKNGFMPMKLNHAHDTLLCDDNRCQERPEIYFCSGMGLNPCYFAFERAADRRRIVIETYGEDSIHVQSVRAPSKFDEELIKAHR